MRLMYSVYDTKAEGLVGGIIMERLDAPAIRAFHDALDAKSNSILSQHPEDFTLLCLGSIEDNGKIFLNHDGPTVVATGAQWAADKFISEEIGR